MSKLQITTALGAVLLVVSCGPPPLSPPLQDTPPPNSGDLVDDSAPNPPNPPDGYENERRRGWLRGSGYPVESKAFQPQPLIQTQSGPTRGQHPVADRTNNPNRVVSPYAPYNVIDVEGFSSGQLARDPSNGKIFRIP